MVANRATGERVVKVASQRELLIPVWDQFYAQLLSSSTSLKIASILEAATPLGRNWLKQLPVNQGTHITNKTFCVSLALRLLGRSESICSYFSGQDGFRHVECCPRSAQHPTARHDAVKFAHKAVLQRIPRSRIIVEPLVTSGDSADRADLRVTGIAALDGVVSDVDFAVHSVATIAARQVMRVADYIVDPKQRAK